MDKFPETNLAHNLNSLNAEEIKKLYGFCPEEQKSLFLNALEESNTSLCKKLNESEEKIKNLKNLNKLLLEKTWEFIGKENKKEAAPFFKKLAQEFE